MNRSQFIEFLLRRYVVVLWLGHDKYQVSRAYSFGPLHEYHPTIQEHLAETSIYDSWRVGLPAHEARRLMARFDETRLKRETLPRIDLIVLTNDESLREFSPVGSDFSLVYQNATFRVYAPRVPFPQEAPGASRP